MRIVSFIYFVLFPLPLKIGVENESVFPAGLVIINEYFPRNGAGKWGGKEKNGKERGVGPCE